MSLETTIENGACCHHFYWTIAGLPNLKQKPWIESPVYYSGVEDGFQGEWQLYIGSSSQNSREMRVYLKLKNCNYALVSFKCTIWVSKELNKIRCSYRSESECLSSEGRNHFGFKPIFIPSIRRKLKGRNGRIGTLEIHCLLQNITFVMPLRNLLTIDPLGQRYWTLYESQELTDMVIAVGEKEFHVHKVVLAANCPVFRAMLRYQTTETTGNLVKVTDIDEITMGKFIKFLYTGRCEGLDESAVDLLACADKYDVKPLFCQAEGALIRNLDVENAITTLEIADTYRAERLKGFALKVITDNLSDIVSSPGWANLPRVLIDAVIKFLAFTQSERLQN